jgi:16S rRNA (uracil1498-N3)-methyltransferase
LSIRTVPRIHEAQNLQTGCSLALSPTGARHVQVLRMQPGQEITLFNGQGGQYAAVIEQMGRSSVQVLVQAFEPHEVEAPRAVHLIVGAPANERMDWLVEKATELGVASIWPVMTERSVLRLSGERATKKQNHWQAIAIAACEQCGRNRVPSVAPMQALGTLWPQVPVQALRGVLSLSSAAQALRLWSASADGDIWLLLGPEGGLSVAEEELALTHGFGRVSLGARVLRAETAALAALASLLT